MLNGLRVVASDLALEKTDKPLREHRRKRWMGSAYHRRIQKKWVKRYGVVMKPCVFIVSPRACGLMGDDHIVAHPSLMAEIQRAIGPRIEWEWQAHAGLFAPR